MPALAVARGLAALGIVGHDGERQRAHAAGAVGVEVIDERQVGLAGTVKLGDALDAEALLERVPYVGAEAVAGYRAHRVLAVFGRRRLVEQVAAHVADVAKGSRAVLADLVPEP
jgi:hypothetical protein